MAVPAKEALVLGERPLDLAVLWQERRAIDHTETLGSLAFGHEEIADAVFGHDARSFLRQRAPQVVGARRVSLHLQPLQKIGSLLA